MKTKNAMKAKAKRLTSVKTGRVDASGWTQPYASTTRSARRAYRAGGKVCDMDDEKPAVRADKPPRGDFKMPPKKASGGAMQGGEADKDAAEKAGSMFKKGGRVGKMDGGPTTGQNDPRALANNMMQSAANQAPVPGSSPIPTYTSNSVKKSPMRTLATQGVKHGGKIKAKDCDGDRDGSKKTPAGTAFKAVPKKIGVPSDPGAPGLKKGGRAGKGLGGVMAGVTGGLLPGLAAGMVEDKDEKKAGGRVERASGGKVKSGKTNINIVIAPQAPDPSGKAAGEGMPPGLPPMMGPPPGPPPGPGGPPGMPPGLPPGLAMGMPPSGPPMMPPPAPGGMPPGAPPPMRAAGGRIKEKYLAMKGGSGSGLGRLEKAAAAAKDR